MFSSSLQQKSALRLTEILNLISSHRTFYNTADRSVFTQAAVHISNANISDTVWRNFVGIVAGQKDNFTGDEWMSLARDLTDLNSSDPTYDFVLDDELRQFKFNVPELLRLHLYLARYEQIYGTSHQNPVEVCSVFKKCIKNSEIPVTNDEKRSLFNCLEYIAFNTQKSYMPHVYYSAVKELFPVYRKRLLPVLFEMLEAQRKIAEFLPKAKNGFFESIHFGTQEIKELDLFTSLNNFNLLLSEPHLNPQLVLAAKNCVGSSRSSAALLRSCQGLIPAELLPYVWNEFDASSGKLEYAADSASRQNLYEKFLLHLVGLKELGHDTNRHRLKLLGRLSLEKTGTDCTKFDPQNRTIDDIYSIESFPLEAFSIEHSLLLRNNPQITQVIIDILQHQINIGELSRSFRVLLCNFLSVKIADAEQNGYFMSEKEHTDLRNIIASNKSLATFLKNSHKAAVFDKIDERLFNLSVSLERFISGHEADMTIAFLRSTAKPAEVDYLAERCSKIKDRQSLIILLQTYCSGVLEKLLNEELENIVFGKTGDHNLSSYARKIIADDLPLSRSVRKSLLMSENAEDSKLAAENEAAMIGRINRSFKRMIDLYHGFGAFTFDARGRVSESSVLSRFSQTLFKEAHITNCSNINSFPGRGFVLSEPLLRKMFLTDNQGNIHRLYHERWKYLSRELELFSSARFFLLRGAIGVVNPNDPWLQINGENQAFIIFNSHFLNISGVISELVPWKNIHDQMQPTLIPVADYSGPRLDIPDIADSNLQPDLLFNYRYTGKSSSIVLNLGSGTNYSGSFSNAYGLWQPRQYPGSTHDIWGNRHKAYYLSPSLSPVRSSDRITIAEILEKDQTLYRSISAGTHYLDILRLALSAFHRGETFADLDEIENEDSDSLEQQSMDEYDNPRSQFSLKEIYGWHNDLKNSGRPTEDFPVFGFFNPLESSQPAYDILILDSYDLSIKNLKTSEVIKLPQTAEPDEDAIQEWNTMILPYFNSGMDFRPFDRRQANNFREF